MHNENQHSKPPTAEWTIKEGQRRKEYNPNYWVEKMRPQIMERIKYYENFLADWGIIAQTGIEQEFWIKEKIDKYDEIEEHGFGICPNHFKDSPFVEKMTPDHWERLPDNGYELAIGTGNEKYQKKYPHESLKPSTIVKATESANKLIEEKSPEYNLDGISFDPTNHKRKLYAQQVNISLWDKKTRTPIFQPLEINELCNYCIKNILEAQNAMIAFYTVNNNAFVRFDNKYGTAKTISLKEEKHQNPSILWRYKGAFNRKNQYGYIENRLGNSDMPPCVNMLITLAGAANGVSEYIQKNNLNTPNELKEHLDQHMFDSIEEIEAKKVNYKLPKNQTEALRTTEESNLAKSILGEQLHKNFVTEYKQKCLKISEHKH